MIRKVSFESQERRIKQVIATLNENGIKDIEEANQICEEAGIDPYQICEDTQRICFENAKWAYVCGAAIAIKKGVKSAADAAEAIGLGLQSFCIPGSVADDRKVGIGHGNLAARLLREETQCFAFLAGHESFAAAEGAIKIAEMANKVRKNPLRCILNGLGKDAAMIISRINGFTYVQTKFDYYTGKVDVVNRIAYSDGPRAKVNCYGADDVREGVAINWLEDTGIDAIAQHEHSLMEHTMAGLEEIPGIRFFGTAPGKAAVISFLVGNEHPYDVGMLLDKLGIAVRTGHHCAQPLMHALGIEGTVRLAFAAYNTIEEADSFTAALKRVAAMLA